MLYVFDFACLGQAMLLMKLLPIRQKRKGNVTHERDFTLCSSHRPSISTRTASITSRCVAPYLSATSFGDFPSQQNNADIAECFSHSPTTHSSSSDVNRIDPMGSVHHSTVQTCCGSTDTDMAGLSAASTAAVKISASVEASAAVAVAVAIAVTTTSFSASRMDRQFAGRSAAGTSHRPFSIRTRDLHANSAISTWLPRSRTHTPRRDISGSPARGTPVRSRCGR